MSFRERFLRVDPGVLLIGIRVELTLKWAALFVGKHGFVLVGKGDGKSHAKAAA